MNCKKCNFYCYDDEYICPNCESLLERELPVDEYERSLFIYNKMVEFKERKRAIKIIKSTNKIILMILILINLIFGAWFNVSLIYNFKYVQKLADKKFIFKYNLSIKW